MNSELPTVAALVLTKISSLPSAGESGSFTGGTPCQSTWLRARRAFELSRYQTDVRLSYSAPARAFARCEFEAYAIGTLLHAWKPSTPLRAFDPLRTVAISRCPLRNRSQARKVQKPEDPRYLITVLLPSDPKFRTCTRAQVLA